jgi:hypothetical protein
MLEPRQSWHRKACTVVFGCCAGTLPAQQFFFTAEESMLPHLVTAN